MCWHIGERINKKVLHDQRAEYGKAIVSTVLTQLPWSAFLEVLPVDDAIAHEFYVTMATAERGSVRKLRNQMDGMLFERTHISRKRPFGLNYPQYVRAAPFLQNWYGESPIFRTDCKFLPFRTEKWPFPVRIRAELFHHPFTTFCGAFSVYESLCLQLCKLLLYRLG